MNTTGYFFAASKFGGFTIQYCTGVPPAPATLALSAADVATDFSHASLTCVSACGEPPAIGVLKTSAGDVSVAFENTSVDALALTEVIDPPLTIICGVPPATGTLYRLSVPWLDAT